MKNQQRSNEFTAKFHQHCRRLERLKDSVLQESADARAVYEQYRNSLQNSKETIERYLHELETAEIEETCYLYRSLNDAINHFEEALVSAELNIHSIRSIPPFLY